MKLALIGYGAMGGLIEQLAREAGHEVEAAPSSHAAERTVASLTEWLRGHQAAIDFSVAGAVVTHVEACALAGVPLVEGTTGWSSQEAEIREIVNAHNGALVYGANFSIGVNLFYRVARYAAKLFHSVNEYDPFIEEAHHKRKRDAPSGTALVLRDLVGSIYENEIPVSSTRAGYIPGTHRIGFDSPAEQITLTHTARSREGFAKGAIFAAEWITGRQGIYEFSQVLDDYLQKRTEQNDA